MFRTITISLYSTVNSALFRRESMSVSYPLVRNRRDFSTRRGVSRRPSRLGSSPSSASMARIVSCILAFYFAVTTSPLAAAPQAAAAPAPQTADPWATADPDALYSQRADIVKAKQAAEVWARRSADGKNHDAG